MAHYLIMLSPSRAPDTLTTEIPIEHGSLRLLTPILDEAHDYYQELFALIAWRQDDIHIHGRRVAIPRLQAWYGEAHCRYTYSGLTLDPVPMPATLRQLADIAAEEAGAPFNCVLCNCYRDGQDSVGWHADNEPELGTNPVIASYSFGASRRFQIKPRRGKVRASNLELPHNSLLIMGGAMQHHWIHQLPKTRLAVSGRINLTFRYIPPPS